MLWACVHLPHLALDGVLRRREDPTAPLALVGGPAHARVIVTANASARAAGIRPGQRVSSAEALLAKFDTQDADQAARERWHQLLAAWAYRYSSEVALLPSAIVLEVEGSMGLFGPWPRFEAKLRDDLTALGFRHRLALAPTPHGAWLLAGSRDGMAVFDETQLGRAVSDVRIEKARLPVKGHSLAGVGVQTFGKLVRLPRDGLRRRFGAELLVHIDRVLGQLPHGLSFYRPPDTFDAYVELSFEVEHVQALLFPVRRLTGDLAAYLAGRDGGVQRFVLRLLHEGQTHTDVVVGLLAAEREPAMLFELTRGRLEQARPPKPVVGLRLIAEELPPFVPAGRDLFDERPAHAIPFKQLRERLRARLGDDAVTTLRGSSDPRPELAQVEDGAVAPPDAREYARRPTWLLPKPIPLRGRDPTILAGPERIETGWWDGGDTRRDYYVVQTYEGQRAWVFSAPGEVGPWMLHGWFA